jgi:uncharacterized protein (TIGR02284 family)
VPGSGGAPQAATARRSGNALPLLVVARPSGIKSKRTDIMAQNKDVAALEALASTLQDSVSGYEDAAKNVSDTGIKSYLMEKAQVRRGLLGEFRQHLTRLGGNTEISGSVSGTLHQRWLDLRSMFQDDTKAAVAEVERGEEYLKERFDSYLESGDLSPEVRNFLADAYAKAKFDNATWDRLISDYS